MILSYHLVARFYHSKRTLVNLNVFYKTQNKYWILRNEILYTNIVMSSKKKIKLLLLVNLSRASGRSILLNVYKYAERHPNWQIRVLQVQEVPETEIVTTMRSYHYDGIISSEMELPAVARYLEQSTIPLVVIGTRKRCLPYRTKNLTFVSCEEESIGALGAKTLLSLGDFKSYAYVHYSEPEYGYLSFLRKRGFRSVMNAHGIRFATFGGHHIPHGRDMENLCRWLSSLPKPCALMAGCDKRAIEVIDACTQSCIRIPDDISILSVDNDEFLCNSSSPALSSITISIGAAGYRAATELNRMLAGKHIARTPAHITVPSKCDVIERESTKSKHSGTALVKRALQFISTNAHTEIRVRDVVENLHASRRLVELRFKQVAGATIHEIIDRTRMDEVRKRLLSRSSTIQNVARSCGFRNQFYLMTKFKAFYGLTIGEYLTSQHQIHGMPAPTMRTRIPKPVSAKPARIGKLKTRPKG